MAEQRKVDLCKFALLGFSTPGFDPVPLMVGSIDKYERKDDQALEVKETENKLQNTSIQTPKFIQATLSWLRDPHKPEQ